MSFSNYLENEILDHILGDSAWLPESKLYIALGTALSDDGTSFTEVTGLDYARVEVNNNPTNWPAASGSEKANGVNIGFGAAGAGGWGTVTHYAIFDDLTGGNMYIWAVLDTPIVVIENDTVDFQVGDLWGRLA